MTEQEAYELLGWPHAGAGNDGDEWAAYRCPTADCQSEGVACNRGFGFDRCGICGAIMERVDSVSAQPGVQVQTPAPARPARPAVAVNIPQEVAQARKLGEQLEDLVFRRGQCPDDEPVSHFLGNCSPARTTNDKVAAEAHRVVGGVPTT